MEIFAHEGPIKHISYSETRGLFSASEKDRVVRIWDPYTMNLEGIIN